MAKIDPSILQSCNPGSTGYATCVRARTGKTVADWSPHNDIQNDAIDAADEAKRYAQFLRFAPQLLADPEDYFGHIPVHVMIDMASKPYLSKSVKDRFAQFGVQMPAVLAQYFD